MAIVIFRTLILYCVLLVTMRLLGKRQLGEMELSEFVLAALVADLAANPLQDIGIPMINGLVPIVVLFCCELLISSISVKSIYVRSVLFGKPCVLISKGVINQKELEKCCFTLDELMMELRSKNALDISRIEYAILEIDGSLSVFPFPEHMPATAGQLGIATDTDAYPTMIISGGRVLEDNLRLMGKDSGWLKKELERRSIASSRDVFLMTLNRAGQIYLAAKDRIK